MGLYYNPPMLLAPPPLAFRFGLVVLAGLGPLLACSEMAERRADLAREEPPQLLQELVPYALDPAQVVAGQTVYVPCYSQAYFQTFAREPQRLPFAISISLRNTDVEHPIIIRSARYYASDGTLLRDFASEGPVAIGPMGSVTQPIAQLDLEGGEGANFLVEWVSLAPVSTPIFEALMISSSGTSAMAFTSRGEVVHER